MATSEQLWLVKSGDKVFGPLLTSEIMHKLRSKEFVVIDEVIAPQGKWKHIRDESIFFHVVEEIRTGLMSSRDDTEVGDGDTKTITTYIRNEGSLNSNSSSASDSGAAADSTDHEAGGSRTNAQFDDAISVARISDAEIVSETNDREIISEGKVRDLNRKSKRQIHRSLSYSPADSVAEGSEGNREKLSVAQNMSRVLWISIGATVVVLFGVFYFYRFAPLQQAKQMRPAIGALQSEAAHAWNRGEYVRAGKLYKKIETEPHLDLEIDVRSAILKLRVGKETSTAKRQLEEILPKLKLGELRAQTKMALGVIDLPVDHELALNQFSKIIQEPDASPIAYFNLAVAQAQADQRQDAIRNLKKLTNHPILGAPSRVLAALLSIKEGQVRAAANLSDVEPESAGAYTQELLAIGAAADWLDGNKKRSVQRLKQALVSDPFQTDEFFYHPLVYTEAVRWTALLPTLKEFRQKSKSRLTDSLYALALVKAGDKNAASMISEELSSRPNDSEMLAVNAYYLINQGRDEEARAALEFAMKPKGEHGLATILQARLCERVGDYDCAMEKWKSILKIKGNIYRPVAAQVAIVRANGGVVTDKSSQTVELLKAKFPNSTLVMGLSEDIEPLMPQPASGKSATKEARR